MKIKLRGGMRSNPTVTLASRIDPIRFSGRMEGGASGTVGEIAVGLSEVPLRVRIPFLKRRHRLLVVGAIGPVQLKLDPFNLSLREIVFGGEGVLGGKEGLSVVSEAKVACQTDFHAEGVAAGGLGLGPLRFDTGAEIPPESASPS